MNRLTEKEKKRLILRYTQLMINKHLLKEKLSPEEEEMITSIPKLLGMSHKEIIQESAKITLGKNLSQDQ